MKNFPLMFQWFTNGMLILVLLMCTANGFFNLGKSFILAISICAAVTFFNFLVLFCAKYVKDFVKSKVQERKMREIEAQKADKDFDNMLNALKLETSEAAQKERWLDYCKKEGIKLI